MRSLPIRVTPLPGEAVDSWLEALAARCEIAWADLAAPIAASSPLPAHGVWVRQLSATQTQIVSALTGVDTQAVSACTLAGSPDFADGLDPATDPELRYGPGGGRLTGSRFCPACLAATGGRWTLVWRSPWTFACTTHHCLLVDVCPQCGRRQRTYAHPAASVPRPGHCAAFVPGPRGTRTLCNADLTQAQVLHLSRHHPAISAQHTIDALLTNGAAQFGLYRQHPCSAPTVLTDIRELGWCFLLKDVPTSIVQTHVPGDIVAEQQAAQSNSRPTGRGPAASAATSAVAATGALSVLGQRDISTAGELLRQLGSPARTRLSCSFVVRRLQPSPVLYATHLSALEPDLGAAEQLRSRLGTPRPCRPRTDSGRIEHLVRTLPVSFWPQWSIRLAGTACSQHRARPALSVSMLIVGSEVPETDVIELLGSPLSCFAFKATLAALKNDPCWPDIRTAIIRLADHLATHEPVIDYQRRRQLNYIDLLPPRDWQRICRTTDTHPRRDRSARRYIQQWLTGTVATADQIDNLNISTGNTANRFAAGLTPQLRQALLHHGSDFLAAHGITDEPVQWQPSFQLLHGLHLPGDHFDQNQAASLQQLVYCDGLTVAAAATTAGLPLDISGPLLQEHPAPGRPRQRRTKVVTAARPGPHTNVPLTRYHGNA